MKRILSLLVCLLLFGSYAVFGQDIQIKGTVTSSEDGSTIPGVYVKVKSTNTGTASDAAGNFQLTVPSNATLVFTSIGFKEQEVVLAGQSTLNIVMESDVTQVDEIVVTALGISREKKSLGYATQEISGDAVSTVKSDNFINSLSGKVAGVNVKANGNMGGSTNIVIRGSKSLTGNNQALFVIDGVPVDNMNTNNRGQLTGRSGYDYGNAASDINANDIESVSVLKGAAASALYGARAANGVVMITTKKGTKQANKALGVSVNSNVNIGVFDKSTFPEFQTQYGAGYGPYYSGGDYPRLREYDADGDGISDLVVPFSQDASLGQEFDPNLMVYAWDSFVPESPNYQKKTPWVAPENDAETFFETAVSYTNSIDITGGDEKSTFRLGYTNLDQSGILPNSSLKKNNLAFNGSYDVLDNLKISASANYNNTKGKGRNSTGYSDNIMSCFRQWYQVNVDIKMLEDLYRKTGKNYTWNRKSGTNPVPAYWDNPYWVRYENYETDERNRLIGFAQADWKASEWLNIMGRVSVDSYNELQEERKAKGSVSGEFGVGRPDVTSGYSRYTNGFLETNVDFMATFKKDIGSNLNINGMVGTNFRRNKRDRVFASTNGGLSVEGVYALSNSIEQMVPPEEVFSKFGSNGYFASLSLGYNNMLYLDGTYRIDQSSTLPKDNWTYKYPSISGSFLFSELVDASWLQLGKLRLNYAEVGSDAPFASVLDVYDPITPYAGNPMVSVPNVKNNQYLKPERTKSIEAGLEMSFLQNRAGFDFAVYKSNTIDQIMDVSVSYATGYSAMYVNAGEIENRGIELRLSGTPVRLPSGLQWDITLNWAKNVNEVVELKDDIKNLELASLQGGITVNARVGEPYGTIQGTDYVYSDDGQRVVGESGYYLFTPTSDIILGNINPDWTGGISNAVTFKNVSFSFLIDWQKGGSIFSLDQYYGQETGLYPETAYINDLGNPVRDPLVDNGDGTYGASSGGYICEGVLEDGSVNTIRIPGDDDYSFGYASYPNSEFVYDASFVKLREVVLTYSIPAKVIAKTFINKASLSFVGSNLWIIHKNLPYADPEAGLSNGNIQGWQSGVMPSTKNFGFSLNLQF